MPESELSHLFTFRVSNGLPNSRFENVANRRRAAKKLISWTKQGIGVDQMTAQVKVGKEWKHDPDTFDLMHRLAEKEVKKGPAEKQNVLTPKKAAGRLATASRLASTADEITEDHVAAVTSAFDDLMSVLGHAPEDPEEEEVEEEEEESDEEDED